MEAKPRSTPNAIGAPKLEQHLQTLEETSSGSTFPSNIDRYLQTLKRDRLPITELLNAEVNQTTSSIGKGKL